MKRQFSGNQNSTRLGENLRSSDNITISIPFWNQSCLFKTFKKIWFQEIISLWKNSGISGINSRNIRNKSRSICPTKTGILTPPCTTIPLGSSSRLCRRRSARHIVGVAHPPSKGVNGALSWLVENQDSLTPPSSPPTRLIHRTHPLSEAIFLLVGGLVVGLTGVPNAGR